MLIGMMHARDDEWCIGYTARVACRWVDKLLVYAHCCTDRTLDIIDQIRQEYPGMICVYVDPDPEWREMDHRQYMLEWARQLKATHMAVIDSDEALTANLIPDIRRMVEETPENQILSLRGVQLWRSCFLYRDDREFRVRFSLAFADHPILQYRPKANGDHMHNGRPPQPLTVGYKPEVEGGILHLQFARMNTLRWKQTRYAMSDLVNHPEYGVQRINQRYSWWCQSLVTTHFVPQEWWAQDVNRTGLMNAPDDGSWYKPAVMRMIEQHGRAKFAGLSDFGLGVLS